MQVFFRSAVLLLKHEPKNYVKENKEGGGHKEYKKSGRKSLVNDLPVNVLEPFFNTAENL